MVDPHAAQRSPPDNRYGDLFLAAPGSVWALNRCESRMRWQASHVAASMMTGKVPVAVPPPRNGTTPLYLGFPRTSLTVSAVKIAVCSPGGQLLLAGWRIRTVTLGIGASSQYGSPSILVAELG